jgi:Protein of unknown function (DUF3617)
MRFLPAALACGLASFLTPAWSQNIKPGLWEITSKVSGNPKMEAQAAQMRELVANMKPEERKQIEDILAQQGIKMGTGPDEGAMIAQTCITPDMAARNRLIVGQRGECTSKTADRTASGMKIAFKCTAPGSSGEGKVTFSGDAGYSMKMHIKTDASGQPESMTLDGSGKWVSAACGDIKPLPAARK